MNSIEVSIIISTFNRNRKEGKCESLIRRALDSIVNQKFESYELIIIDDGSTDGTKEICQEYADKYPFVIFNRHEVNSGIPAVRYNEGIRMAKGKYIMFMFDDDMLYDGAIYSLYNLITTEYKDCGMIYGTVDYYNQEKIYHLNFGREWDAEQIKTINFIGNLSVIVSKSVFKEVGGYDESQILKRICDWELWKRIGRKYKVSKVPVLIGRVNGCLSDSIGSTAPYESDKISRHIHNVNRKLPLKDF